MSISSKSIFNNVHVPHSSSYHGPFGRLFRNLPQWTPSAGTDEQIADAIRAFANTSMSEAANEPEADNHNLPAGYTYFGQFVDHDITFDPTSSLQRLNDPNKLHNFRTPRLDLDCLYGEGPADEPFMYDNDKGGMFLIGATGEGNEPDLPRNIQGRALIGDMRNDENTIVSQFQLAMLRLHNRIYAQLMFGDPDITPDSFARDDETFDEARRILRWFYQYIVWNDFIKRLIKDDIWNSVLKKENGIFCNNARFFKWEYQPFMPVEFSVAAYRFGHSLVRPGYQVNLNTDAGLGFGVELPIFHPGGSGAGQDLHGFRPMPGKHTIQWDWFFKMASSSGPFPQPSRRIDPKLSSAVFKVPEGPGGVNHLAFLNLMRSWRMGLPKGTAVAAAMGFTPHDIDDPHEDMLWHYVLKESSLLPANNKGRMLGSVGSTIVGEVFAGLLYGDSHSYIRMVPDWTPAAEPVLMALLPAASPENGGDWEVADLLRASGAPVNDSDVASTIASGHN